MKEMSFKSGVGLKTEGVIDGESEGGDCVEGTRL